MIGALKARLPELRLDEVEDPRDRRGKRWKIESLLTAPLVAILAGMRSLAETEALTRDLSPAARRALKLPRRVPDTTMRDALVEVDPVQLRASLHAQIQAAQRRKALQPTGLPFGVIAMDGKATAIAAWDDKYAQRQTHSGGFGVSGVVRTVTSCLTSSAAKVCVDASPIPPHRNEMSHFCHAFDSLLEAHSSLFQLITYDAGAASLANASYVVEAGKDYLFALNSAQPTLYAEARAHLGRRSVRDADETTEDVVGPYTVTRRIYLTEELSGFLDWSHLRTVARVTYEKIHRDTGEIMEEDERYFLSSLPVERLSPKQWMQVIRSHWAVENNCHHTWDTVFNEDDQPWIDRDPQGMVVMLLIRRLAYNFLALFRSVTQRSEERRGMPWKDLLRWAYNMLIGVTDEQLAGLRARKQVGAPNA
jgi:predicted transposase YbfD/YdcC